MKTCYKLVTVKYAYKFFIEYILCASMIFKLVLVLQHRDI
jgi:hypothetical protein